MNRKLIMLLAVDELLVDLDLNYKNVADEDFYKIRDKALKEYGTDIDSIENGIIHDCYALRKELLNELI